MESTSRNDGASQLLLVDDDQALCSALARALRRRGFHVTVAHDQCAALAAASETPPQYAVVDLRFPGGSGLCLVSRLIEADPQMRIVVLTGYASIATAIEAVKLGAHNYLAKPADADAIVTALRGDVVQPAMPVEDRPLSLNRLAWEHIHRVLMGNKGNVSATARVLGMHRRTLQRKLSKHPVRD